MGTTFGLGFMGLGGLWMILFWALVIALVVWLVRMATGNAGHGGQGCCGGHGETHGGKDKGEQKHTCH